MPDSTGPVLPPGRVAPPPPVTAPVFGSGHRPGWSTADGAGSARPPAPPVRRLRRSGRACVGPSQGRVLAGVAAGLAEHLDLPVRAIRIAFVVASIVTGGAGVVAYVLLWALTPQQTADPAAPKRPGRVRGDAPYARGTAGTPDGGGSALAELKPPRAASGLSRERVQALVGGSDPARSPAWCWLLCRAPG